MIADFLLMHKSIPFGAISIEYDSGAVLNVQVTDSRYAPYLGNVNAGLMKSWWRKRAIPESRKSMIARIRQLGYENSGEYLAKNLALSISDTYWINPLSMMLKWDDIKLIKKGIPRSSHIVPYHNESSYDPSASLGGEMDKYWEIKDGKAILHKIGYISGGQQSVNECFASYVHERLNSGVEYVKYRKGREHAGGIESCCDAFTDERIELVSAEEIIGSVKIRHDQNAMDVFRQVCVSNGLSEKAVQEFIDYQIATDYILGNSDRHLGNFGVIRNADTLSFISPAPIYDTGNSMFYLDDEAIELSGDELSNRKINSVCQTEKEMFALVHDRSIIDADRLPDKSETYDFYINMGMDKKRAAFIASNYEKRVRFYKELI